MIVIFQFITDGWKSAVPRECPSELNLKRRAAKGLFQPTVHGTNLESIMRGSAMEKRLEFWRVMELRLLWLNLERIALCIQSLQSLLAGGVFARGKGGSGDTGFDWLAS